MTPANLLSFCAGLSDEVPSSCVHSSISISNLEIMTAIASNISCFAKWRPGHNTGAPPVRENQHS